MRELPTGLTKRTRFRFLNDVVGTLQMISGVLDGTMSRNASHIFLKLGRNLERTDMTSRIVDVRSAQLLPAETPELRPFETVQWMSVLKSPLRLPDVPLARCARGCAAPTCSSSCCATASSRAPACSA